MTEYLKQLVENGGPEPHEYPALSDCLARMAALIAQGSEHARLLDSARAALAPTLSRSTMQGFAFLKPYGYSGDFEIIERIYTYWHSPDAHLVRWDRYFHAQHAPRAVRNRKEHFSALLRRLDEIVGRGPIPVLNVGSGSARDIFDFLSGATPHSRIVCDCVDHDSRANEYASHLCLPFDGRVTFHTRNALRFRPERRYRLIWSGGLFDYFDDRVFVATLRRLMRGLDTGGHLVVGNFATANPSRDYMEIVGDWRLHYRDEARLRQLAIEAGVEASRVRIDREPEGVNLFLCIENAA